MESEIEALEELIRLQTHKVDLLQKMRVMYLNGARPPPTASGNGGDGITKRALHHLDNMMVDGDDQSYATITSPTTTGGTSTDPEDFVLLRGQLEAPAEVTVLKTFTFQMVREGWYICMERSIV